MNATLHEIIELTDELIRFRSTASNQSERTACADFIFNWLERNHITARRMTVDGVDSILALPDSGHCRVLLMAHFDVVDAPEHLFTPEVKDGKLFGRGANDDKYAVATSMVLLKRLRERGEPGSTGTLGILLSGDEEVGGRRGAQQALKHVSADFCIALDGGNPESMVVLEKGVLRLKLTANGKAAHGARPWMGVNAIELLMADLAALKPIFDVEAPEHWHRTLNIGMIHGGTVVNMVPATAEASLDIRYTEHDDPDALLASIKAVVAGEITLIRRDSIFNGGQSPLLERLRKFAPKAQLTRAHGASDARFLSEHAIPGIVWGAEGAGTQHSEGEYLVIESLERLVTSLEGFLDSLHAEEAGV
ncbi:MAG: M20 family metallopeptidase [Acidobacteriota bacterium]